MAIASLFLFITAISSSMIAPASEQVAAQFGATNTVVIANGDIHYSSLASVCARHRHPGCGNPIND